MGRSFAAGTTDGSGSLDFSQGWVLLGIVVSVAMCCTYSVHRQEYNLGFSLRFY